MLGPTGAPLDAAEAGFDGALVSSRSFPAVAFHPRPKSKAGVNLLSGDKAKQPALAKEETAEGAHGYSVDGETKKVAPPREIISFIKPNLTVAMVDDFSAYNAKAVPDTVRRGRRGKEGASFAARVRPHPAPRTPRCCPTWTSTLPP